MATANKNSKPRTAAATASKAGKKAAAKDRPFAAEEPISEEEARILREAAKRSRDKAKNEEDLRSMTPEERAAARRMAREEQAAARRMARERTGTEATTPEDILKELQRERDMQRGEAAAKKQMGTLGFKKGGMVTARGQGKVMRTRKTRTC